MGSGIRLAASAIPRVSVKDATPEALVTPASPLATGEDPAAAGTHLARPRAPLQAHALARGRQARPPVSAVHASGDRVSAIRLSLGRVPVTPHSDRLATRDLHPTHRCLETRIKEPSAVFADLATEALAVGVGAGTVLEDLEGTATVGGQVIGPATAMAGTLAFSDSDGVGEAGASDWDGHTGPATGDRAGHTAGIPGGTTLIGMRPGRRTTTIGNILTGCITIRRPTIPTPRMTTTQVIPSLPAWIPKLCT